MRDKILDLLGFARKSGNLIFGFQLVKKMVERNDVKLVILAKDISPNTEKKILKVINMNNVPIIKYSNNDELSKSIGQTDKAILAVTDKKLANRIGIRNNKSRYRFLFNFLSGFLINISKHKIKLYMEANPKIKISKNGQER